MDSTTAAIVEFATSLSLSDLPEAARMATKVRVLDTYACAWGGIDGDPVIVAKKAFLSGERFQSGETMGAARVLTGERGSVEAAAFVNSLMARYLDFNDAHQVAYGHPSDMILPLFNVAESTGASGEEVIAGGRGGLPGRLRDHPGRWHALQALGDGLRPGSGDGGRGGHAHGSQTRIDRRRGRYRGRVHDAPQHPKNRERALDVEGVRRTAGLEDGHPGRDARPPWDVRPRRIVRGRAWCLRDDHRRVRHQALHGAERPLPDRGDHDQAVPGLRAGSRADRDDVRDEVRGRRPRGHRVHRHRDLQVLLRLRATRPREPCERRLEPGDPRDRGPFPALVDGGFPDRWHGHQGDLPP